MTLTLRIRLRITGAYDDGGGNTGNYHYWCQVVLDGRDFTLPEQKFYSAKLFSFTKPTDLDLEAHSITGSGGSPPAYTTRKISFTSTGQMSFTDTDEVLSMIYFDVQVISMTHEENLELDTQQQCVVSNVTEMDLNIDQGVYDSHVNITSETYDVNNVVITAPGDLSQVGDAMTVHYIPTASFVLADFRLSDIQIIFISKNLYDLDYSLGSSIEKAIKMGLMVLGLSKGSLGPTFGLLADRLGDGELGDLDIPMFSFIHEVREVA